MVDETGSSLLENKSEKGVGCEKNEVSLSQVTLLTRKKWTIDQMLRQLILQNRMTWNATVASSSMKKIELLMMILEEDETLM